MDRKTFLAAAPALGAVYHQMGRAAVENPRGLTATLYIQPDGTIQVLNFVTKPGSIDRIVYDCLSLEVALATLAALAGKPGAV